MSALNLALTAAPTLSPSQRGTPTRAKALIAALVLAAGSLSMATGSAQAQEAAQPGRPAGTLTPGPIKDLSGWPPRDPLPDITDPQIGAAVSQLSGSFQSEPVGDTPALVYNAARVDVSGLGNAVYFEIARADSPWKAVRQGIFHVAKRPQGLSLRVYDFAGTPTFGEAVMGLWLAPEVFPAMSLSKLAPSCDFTLTLAGQKHDGRTPGRVPTVRGGAWEFESSIAFDGGEIAMSDRGFDVAGKQVFGTPEGKPVVFKKLPAPKTQVKRLEGGLIAIDFVPPVAGQIEVKENGARVAVHFTGYLQTDGTKFAGSKDPRWDNAPSDPQLFSLPGRMLSGWSMGIPGITKGTMRRLLMPSGLAFGTIGSPTWKVPPNTAVIFDVECMYVEDKPPTPPTPPTPAAPTGGEGEAKKE